MAKRTQLDDMREACEDRLYTYACVVEPHRAYGDIHKAVYDEMQAMLLNNKDDDNLLILLPRDHQKSHMAAVAASWMIARDPTITILYVSATATLAQKQLRDIKQIISSPIHQQLWPELIHPEEGKRSVWNTDEIVVDHPKRAEAGVRDSTVTAAGLGKTVTGLHCRLIVKDDVVVPDNAYTQDARKKVAADCSQLASIQTTGSKELCVGTRYHPKDHYNDLKEMEREVYDKKGELIKSVSMYRIIEHPVEEYGQFIWPREINVFDKRAYGFDMNELAKKKAKYIDKVQFHAQYYNNPNDTTSAAITRELFQYYDPSTVQNLGGAWYIGDRRLNLYTGMDFAYSVSRRADHSTIVIIGVDYEYNVYVLDIDRFKTDRAEVYFKHLLAMVSKWELNRVRAEVTVAQRVIVEYLKDRCRTDGLRVKIEDHNPTRHDGRKEERISATLEPLYQNKQVYHCRGGYTSLLEEELLLDNPPHDDIKDGLTIALSNDIRKPMRGSGGSKDNVTEISYHPRFGGTV